MAKIPVTPELREESDFLESQREIKYAIHSLTADILSNTNDIASLRFSNLEIGKKYRLTMKRQAVDGGATAALLAIHNGSQLLNVRGNTDSTSSNDRSSTGVSVIFVATGTTITFNYEESDGGAFLEGNGTTQETFAMLEELPNHVVTTQWD